jgi:HK97 family phage prohead protease
MSELERRSLAEPLTLEVREDNGTKRTVMAGYAAVFNQLSVPLGGGRSEFVEKIQPGAFRDYLSAGGDVVALWDHDVSTVLGRRSAGTLRLAEDHHGLRVEVDLPDTQAGRDAAELVRRRDVQGMSFGFRNAKDAWTTEGGKKTRTIISAEVFDVSPTAFPAYRGTDVQVALRRLASDEERSSRAADEAERRRRHLRLLDIDA